MTTAVLMTESWRPAILHIAPFSNNGKEDANGYGSPYSNRKSFPVLAVTRTNSADIVKKQSTSNQVSRQNSKDNRSNDNASKRLPSKFVKKRAKSYPSTEVDYPPLANFHDLNDDLSNDLSSRTTSAASVDTQFSSASASISEPPSNRYLPKPTFSNKGSYFGQTVVKRTTTLTPGEAELQKHRENYALEQAQKKPKYKLNVNQLPRSTTPIEDNDPDKLNMKQVIQFLQNKQSARSSHDNRMSFGRRYISTTAKFHRRSEKYSTKQRPWSDIPGQNITPYILDEKSDTNNEPLPSARSSPDVSQKPGTPRKTVRSSLSEKIHKEKKSKIELKSFKLYRFLAFAPDEKGQTNDSSSFEDTNNTLKESAETDMISKEKEIKKRQSLDTMKHKSPRFFRKHNKCDDGNSDGQIERQNVPTTANLMHRRLRERQRKNEVENEPKQNLLAVPRKSSCGTIRLPSMQDFYEEKVESVVDEQIKPESDKFVIPLVCITPPTEPDNVHTSPQSTNSDRFFQYTQKVLTPRFSIPEKADVRKVSVNVPQEMENSPVKLMLRQEKNVTREQSYMYELESAKSVYSNYPFPQENFVNLNQSEKSENASLPMSSVYLKQENAIFQE